MSSIISSKRIAKNVGIFGGAQAFSVLAALIRNKVAAEVIGSAAVGLSAIYTTAVSFISSFAGLGLSFSGVKHLSEVFSSGDADVLQEEVCRLRRIGIVCALVGFVISVAVSPLLSMIYFSDFQHTIQFSLLSVYVVTSILSGIELAVMKSCQKIRYLTSSMIWTAFVSVLVSVPMYLFYGLKGVFWAVLISGVCESVLALYLGDKTVSHIGLLMFDRYKSSLKGFSHSSLFSLGLAFLISGVIASGSEIVIQSFMTTVASVSVLGLYRAGYQLSITYTSMIFTALGNDFFPRLSGLCQDVSARNLLVSRQIKVLLCVTTPLVIVFILLVPYLLPMLFADTFTPVCRMVQIASLSVIIKSFTSPLNFLPLSLAKSVQYIMLEGTYWVLLAIFVISGYMLGGLDGAGVGILLCHIVEVTYVFLFCRKYYGFRFVV